MSLAALRAKRQVLEQRAAVLRAARDFFHGREYLEVETPCRICPPALEEHIDAEVSGNAWLRTSPELHMKRMLCAGYPRLMQIGPCFRHGERGSRHLPEYTMLEWYRCGADHLDLLEETQDLLRVLAAAAGVPGRFDPPLPRWTVTELFLRHAGWDPCQAFDADRFDLDLVEKVEPWLCSEPGAVLMNFPVERAALARCQNGVACRWELYLSGMEIANAYWELTDPHEQRQRFAVWEASRRARGAAVYPLDEAFLAALEEGMPDCAGIALGLDRLMMMLAGRREIADVVAFAD